MTDAGSEILARRLLDGDRAAFEELLERHLPGLRAYVRLQAGDLVLSKESGTDIVQSACREILTKIDRFHFGGEAGFKQWLYMTALRKIRNHHAWFRAKKRDAAREVRACSTVDEDEALDCYRSFYTPSRQAQAREELEAVEQAMQQLTEDQREVIALSRLVGLSHAEIAEQTGRSEEAVRALLYRGLGALTDLVAASLKKDA